MEQESAKGKEPSWESKESQQTAPRPRRRKVGGHGGGHGGSWKVAYADFVTAMLALFIVLWILSQNDELKKAVDSYFTDPIAYKQVIKQKGRAPGQGESVLKEARTVDQIQEEERQAQDEIDRLKDALTENDVLDKIADQVEFQYTNEGILIEMRDTQKFDFFEIGSAKMSPEMVELVRILTPEIIRMNSPVVITGHSDSRQYPSDQYTNWELSADRANSVRRQMISYGLPLDMISEIRSYADTRLRNPKDPLSPENRRVSILVLRHAIPTFKDKMVIESPSKKGKEG
jgi:chemotaxis protein MotB